MVKNRSKTKTKRKTRDPNWSRKARAKGYAVENDSVKKLKSWGWWAKRNPSKQQTGQFHVVDYFFWNPFTQRFGFGQAKYKREYLHRAEREELEELSRRYKCDILFSWRDRGIWFQSIVPFSENISK